MKGDAELFEAGPSDWPVPWPFRLTYGLYLVCGAVVSMPDVLTGRSIWGQLTPTLFAPFAGTVAERLVTPAIVLGVLTLFELVRQAEGRSRRYVVTRSEVRLVRGVVRPVTIAAFPSEGARLEASPEGPAIATRHGRIICRGLAPHLWADLARAVRAAGGVVALDFEPS